MILLATLRELWADFIGLLYPNTCQACETLLVKGEEIICTTCRYELPYSDLHLRPDNPLEKVFWGRVHLEQVIALFTFRKGSGVQHLVHQLKYHERQDVGVELGRMLAKRAKEQFEDIDAIIPVPLHPKKLNKRGFNQSEVFAKGLAEVLFIPIDTSSLIRSTDTDTQTKKSRDERWLNVKDIFEVADKRELEGKHVLLVDDVVTTGATLEACSQKLLQVEGVKVSIATIAMAQLS